MKGGVKTTVEDAWRMVNNRLSLLCASVLIFYKEM